MSVNMNFACFGTWRTLDFVFTCYQSLIFSKLLMYKKYEKGQSDSRIKESQSCVCELYSVKGVIDLEIVDLTLIIMFTTCN